MMLKKFLSFLIVCVLAFGLAGCIGRRPQPSVPEEPGKEDPVDLPSTDPFEEGDGTESSPYLIYTAQQLAEMSDFPAGTYFRQACDIDLSSIDTGDKEQSGTVAPLDRWSPLGTASDPFLCNFDGNGYEISNLSIQRFDFRYTTGYYGLFGYARDCTIENVTLRNQRVEVRYASSSGALIGFAERCIIRNCRLIQGEKANYESGSWSFSNMGGLIGFANECYIIECTVNSDLSMYGQDVEPFPSFYPQKGMLGGVVGEMRYGHAYNLSYSGTLQSNVVAGGIVGRCDGAELAGCESDGTVISPVISGGLIGQMWRSTLQYGEFTGALVLSDNETRVPLPQGYGYMGGIVGDAGLDYGAYYPLIVQDYYSRPSEIISCRFSGTIDARQPSGVFIEAVYAGGICGRAFDFRITDAEVCGDITSYYANGLTGALFDGATQLIERAVIGDTALTGYEEGYEGITDSQNCTDVFVENGACSSIPHPFVSVSDWNTVSGLSSLLWQYGSGRPSLHYAGLLGDDFSLPLWDLPE